MGGEDGELMESAHKQTFITQAPTAVPSCRASQAVSVEVWPDGVVAIVRVDRRETGAALGCRCFGEERDCPESDAVARGYMFSAAKGKHTISVIIPAEGYAEAWAAAVQKIEQSIAETRRIWHTLPDRADGKYAEYAMPEGGIRT